MQYKGCIIIVIFPVFLPVSADGDVTAGAEQGARCSAPQLLQVHFCALGQSSSTLLCHCRRPPHAVLLQAVLLPVLLGLCCSLLTNPAMLRFMEAAQSSQTAPYGGSDRCAGLEAVPCRCHRAAEPWSSVALCWCCLADGSSRAGRAAVACRAQCKREGAAFLCKTHNCPLPASLNNVG